MKSNLINSLSSVQSDVEYRVRYKVNAFEDDTNKMMMQFMPDLNNYLDYIRITIDKTLMDYKSKLIIDLEQYRDDLKIEIDDFRSDLRSQIDTKISGAKNDINTDLLNTKTDVIYNSSAQYSTIDSSVTTLIDSAKSDLNNDLSTQLDNLYTTNYSLITLANTQIQNNIASTITTE